MYEAYLAKGDLVLPAFCPGESLLPLLWHSFALSLSGGERESKSIRRGRKGGDESRHTDMEYEEMACKSRAELVNRGKDTGEEGKETKRKMCESERG